MDTIVEAVRNSNLIKEHQHIVIGLSGGPDSVCLFHVLNGLAKDMDLHLVPVHVNHKIRPGEAEADQAYVEALCRQKGLECHTVEFDCNGAAKERGETPEEAGRNMRYRVFQQEVERLREEGIPEENIAVALAHNADDQVETILFRILRGTGVKGLGAMAPALMDERGISIIRPLLAVQKSEILAYCERMGLATRMDRTNQLTEYARNRIRLELIPTLETYNPQVKEALLRLGQQAAEEKEYMDRQAEAYMAEHMETGEEGERRFDETLGTLHPALRKQVIRRTLISMGLLQDLTAAHYDSMEALLRKGAASGNVDLPHGYRATTEYGRLVLRAPNHLQSQGAEENASLRLNWRVLSEAESRNIRNENRRNGISLGGEVSGTPLGEEGNGSLLDRDANGILLDGRALEAAYGPDYGALFQLRTRRPGDWMAIRGGRKKLQNFFVDEKVPRENRDRIPLVAIGSEVLLVPAGWGGLKQHRKTTNYSVSEHTNQVILVEIIGTV